MKESAPRMEKIPSAMVLRKHVDGADTRLSTMEGPLVKILLVNGLERSEKIPNKQRLKISVGHTKPCIIFVQT